MKLHEKKCSCGAGTKLVSASELGELQEQVPGWTVLESKKLQRSFKFADFRSALALANEIGAIAEEEGHHPDLLVRWGELVVTIWTHSLGGLSEADFVLAAKIECLSSSLAP